MVRGMFTGAILISLFCVAGCGTAETDPDEWLRQVNDDFEKLQMETVMHSVEASIEYQKTIERLEAEERQRNQDAASVNQMPR